MTTQRKTWPEIFHDAWKWPDYRVYGWAKAKSIDRKVCLSYTKFFRASADPLATRTIYLSDDLVWAVSKLSLELDPSYLLQQALLARMPFDNTILEWNGEMRRMVYKELFVLQEVGEEGHPDYERPAILVRQKGDGKNIYNFAYNEREKEFVWFPLKVALNIGGSNLNDYNQYIKKLTARGEFVVTQSDYLFSSTVVKKHPDLEANILNSPLQVTMSGPIYLASLRAKRAVQLLTAGTAGQFRWFAALCTLLNRQTMVRYVDAPPPDPATSEARKRTSGDKPPQQALLMLPREKVVKRVLHIAKVERDRKKVGLHEVIGHWCYSRVRGTPNCSHQWPLQPTRRQVCETCGMTRWFREAHQRGEGDTLKVKARRADFSGVSVDRLAEQIKQGH